MKYNNKRQAVILEQENICLFIPLTNYNIHYFNIYLHRYIIDYRKKIIEKTKKK